MWSRGPYDAVKSNLACTKRMTSARGRSSIEYSLRISSRTEFQFLVMAGTLRTCVSGGGSWCCGGLVLGSDASSGFSRLHAAFISDGLGQGGARLAGRGWGGAEGGGTPTWLLAAQGDQWPTSVWWHSADAAREMAVLACMPHNEAWKPERQIGPKLLIPGAVTKPAKCTGRDLEAEYNFLFLHLQCLFTVTLKTPRVARELGTFCTRPAILVPPDWSLASTPNYSNQIHPEGEQLLGPCSEGLRLPWGIIELVVG